MSRFHLLGLALALACCSASAHETQPADWCPAGTHPVIVSEFSFTSEQLIQYQELQTGVAAGSESECGDPKTCGIVDQWYWANDMATDHCGGIGVRGKVPEDAIAFVQYPEVFNLESHHDGYRHHKGPLIGQCVVCRGSAIPGAPPEDPSR